MLYVPLPRILGLLRRFASRTIPLFLLAIFSPSLVPAQTATTRPAKCKIASAIFEGWPAKEVGTFGSFHSRSHRCAPGRQSHRERDSADGYIRRFLRGHIAGSSV